MLTKCSRERRKSPRKKEKSRVARSERELQAAAGHVGYELVQLAAMPNALREADEAGQDRVAKACLESMLLHARNLVEFLIESSWDSDVRRSDFAPRWSAPNIPAKKRLQDARPTWDRNLSHISWERIEGGDAPDHYYQRVAGDVVDVMGTFVEHLKAEANPAAEWFDGNLQQARMLVYHDRAGGPVASYSTSGAHGQVTHTGLAHVPAADSDSGVGGTAPLLTSRALILLIGALERLVEALRGLQHRDGA
jgi:hypothetical protein